MIVPACENKCLMSTRWWNRWCWSWCAGSQMRMLEWGMHAWHTYAQRQVHVDSFRRTNRMQFLCLYVCARACGSFMALLSACVCMCMELFCVCVRVCASLVCVKLSVCMQCKLTVSGGSGGDGGLARSVSIRTHVSMSLRMHVYVCVCMWNAHTHDRKYAGAHAHKHTK